MKTTIVKSLATMTLAISAPSVQADSNEDLAKQLANPISSLISVPFEILYDQGLGATGSGSQTTLVAKPVVPFSIDDNWNLISRTIIPYVILDDVTPGTSQSGFGDILQSFFLSPKSSGTSGVTWGAGPIFQIPTSSSNNLGRSEWGAGLTVVALKQSGPWTLGGLANHVWGGNDQSTTFLQPFVNYTTPTSWTFALNTESTYDWETDDWSVPINVKFSKLVGIGSEGLPTDVGSIIWRNVIPGTA